MEKSKIKIMIRIVEDNVEFHVFSYGNVFGVLVIQKNEMEAKFPFDSEELARKFVKEFKIKS